MPWTEFCSLLSGIMPDTPLGNIVTIRAETDPEMIKKFTPEQRRIHSDWESRRAQKRLDDPQKYEEDMKALATMMAAMFGG